MINGAGHWLQQERPAEVNDGTDRLLVEIGVAMSDSAKSRQLS